MGVLLPPEVGTSLFPDTTAYMLIRSAYYVIIELISCLERLSPCRSVWWVIPGGDLQALPKCKFARLVTMCHNAKTAGLVLPGLILVDETNMKP
jgi:hypothetical protein